MADLDPLGALAEPNRRALYDHVVERGGWVSRDQAADAVGLERGTAAHHLDRLAADGLLDVDYRRLSGRRGPGAGRPAKVYRRSDREFAVSLPPRDYGLAGRLLAEAADRSRLEGVDLVEALATAARAEGHRLTTAVRTGAAPNRTSGSAHADPPDEADAHTPGRTVKGNGAQAIDEPGTAERSGGAGGRTAGIARTAVLQVLSDHGFEPEQAEDGTVVLRNCPFHELAQRHRELICGMNLCLLDAAVEKAGSTGLSAQLDPAEGFCCVKLLPDG